MFTHGVEPVTPIMYPESTWYPLTHMATCSLCTSKNTVGRWEFPESQGLNLEGLQTDLAASPIFGAAGGCAGVP